MRTRTLITSAAFLAASAAAGTAFGQAQLKGSDTLFEVTKDVITACGLTANLEYIGQGSGGGQSAMAGGPSARGADVAPAERNRLHDEFAAAHDRPRRPLDRHQERDGRGPGHLYGRHWRPGGPDRAQRRSAEVRPLHGRRAVRDGGRDDLQHCRAVLRRRRLDPGLRRDAGLQRPGTVHVRQQHPHQPR